MRSRRVLSLLAVVTIASAAALASIACSAPSDAGASESDLGTKPPREWTPAPPKTGNLRIAEYNIRNFPVDVMGDADAGSEADGGTAPDRDTRPPLVRKQDHTDEAALVDILEKLDFDVLAVEEINDTQRFDEVLARLGARNGRAYESVYSLAWAHPQHTGIIVRKDRLRIESPKVHGEIATRPTMRAGLSARIVSRQSGGVDFGILVLHLASGDAPKRALLRADQARFAGKVVAERQAELGDRDFIVVGDMNTARESQELPAFDSALAGASSGLVRQPPDLACSTYYTKGPQSPVLQPSYIDNVYFASMDERDTTVPVTVGAHCFERSCQPFESDSAEHGTSYWSVSDHCPVYFEIADVDRD
jgi:endonuclease/exonuclease/phosphatase family metal-dependent hydrolase